MKKTVLTILLAAALLSLAGCGSHGGAEPAAAPTADPAPMAAAAASDTDAALASQTHIPPASPTDLSFDEDSYDLALGYVGRTLQELYAAIGQPIELPLYSPSEAQPGAQDGKLTYTGFYVITLRTDTGEVVQEIRMAEE